MFIVRFSAQHLDELAAPVDVHFLERDLRVAKPSGRQLRYLSSRSGSFRYLQETKRSSNVTCDCISFAYEFRTIPEGVTIVR